MKNKPQLLTFVALATFAVQDLSAANPAKDHGAAEKATSNYQVRLARPIAVRAEEMAEAAGALEINAAKLAKDLSPGGQQRRNCEGIHSKKECDEYAQVAQCLSASSKKMFGPSLTYIGMGDGKHLGETFNEILLFMGRDATYSD